MKKELETKANGKVLKVVYEVTLLENNVKIQPTNELLISIPYPSGVVNPKIFVEQKGGSYQEVNAKETNGNLEYTASYLGKVSVFADPDDKPSTSVPSTSVLGNYNSGTGGAETGDSTSIGLYIVLGGFSLLGIYIQVRKKNNM